MPRSKEISEDIRRKVVEAHESGKGYKLISKAIGLPKTTIRAILRKWKRFGTVVTLPRSGRPSKISPRARREIIREVMKNPCTTSKDLQATLASSNICVHQSTIRRILGIHGRPTLSSFEGSMALQASSQEEEGALDASVGLSQDVKNEDKRQVLKNSNTNSDNTSKDNAKCPEKNKEVSGHDKNCGDGEKTLTNNNGDDKNENRDEETPSTAVNGAGGADVQTASANHNGAEAASSNPNSGAGAGEERKRDVETAVVDNDQSGGGDDDGNRRGAGYATGHDVNSAYSTNNNGGNWSEEMDYISTLTFS